MEIAFTYWQEKDGTFLGYLNDFPEHWSQGVNLQDLKEHLKDLHEIFHSEPFLPGIKKVDFISV